MAKRLCEDEHERHPQESTSPANGWRARASRATSIRPTPTTSSATTRRRRRAGSTPRSRPPRPRFPAWSRTTPQERHDILARVATEILARRDELGRLLAREEGKTLPEAHRRSRRAPAQIFEFFAGEALRIPGEKFASVRPGVDVEVTREPVGVVGVIAPWNFPDRHPRLEDRAGARLRQLRGVQAGRPGARLAPTRSPKSSFAPALPKGVFNLVMGRGSVVGQAMLDHRGVDADHFHRLGRDRPQGRGRLR